jgi:hypothetical protein
LADLSTAAMKEAEMAVAVAAAAEGADNGGGGSEGSNVEGQAGSTRAFSTHCDVVADMEQYLCRMWLHACCCCCDSFAAEQLLGAVCA